MPTTPLSSFPAPMRWLMPPMSPRPRSRRATSRSASSRFRCPRSAPSSNAPAPQARRRSSIRRPRSNSTPKCSISSISSSSMKANSACWRRPGFATPTIMRASSTPRGRCRRKDKIICVTLGKRGVVALVNDEPVIIPGRAVKAVDTTGAGDCFVGAVAAQLAGGKSIQRRAGLRQCRGFDLGAADGRGAVDADGGGSRGSSTSSRRTPGPIIPVVCNLKKATATLL